MRIRYAFAGAALAVAGIAAEIVASDHRPNAGFDPSRYFVPARAASGWSATAYDAVRIGGWVLVACGAVLIASVLWRTVRRAR